MLICGLFSIILVFFLKVPGSFRSFSNSYLNNEFNGLNLFKQTESVPTGKNLFNFVNNSSFKALLFNLIPIKNIGIQQIGEPIYVSPCGTPFGLKFLTDGVMIIDYQSVTTKNGVEYPAKKAGLIKSDVIVYANGQKILSNKQLKNLIKKSNGNNINLTIRRNFKEIEITIKPEFSVVDNSWQAGILVRDSSAGLGTLTFSTQSGFFGGLGHAVFDINTESCLPLGSGEIVEASINEIKMGDFLKPGELCGEFSKTKPIGKIETNTSCGLYGRLNKPLKPHDFLPIGLKHEVQKGRAFIYSTIEGCEPKQYEIEIESIDYRQNSKNFVLKIVDKELLNKTGGIVQGMSGSPIIQNGKFIGAITHVFLNDAKRGYGIFAETMLEISDDVNNIFS